MHPKIVRWCDFGDLFTYVMSTEPMEARVAHSYYRQLIAALLACAAAKDEARAPGGDGVLHLDVKVSVHCVCVCACVFVEGRG